MPVLEAAGTIAWLAFPLPLLLGAWMTTKMTAKDATDRIASFLPTATTAAFQLILSAYPQNGVCTVGQKVLLWISLCVLMLVTGGMAIIQQIHETDSSLKEHFSKGNWQYSLGRAAFSAVAFFFVSFLTAPAPGCLVPGSGIPSNAAWIVAVLLGSILALAALHGQQLGLSHRDGSSPELTEHLNRPDDGTDRA